MRYPKWLLGQKVAVVGTTILGTVVEIKQHAGVWMVRLYHSASWYDFFNVEVLAKEEYEDLRAGHVR